MVTFAPRTPDPHRPGVKGGGNGNGEVMTDPDISDPTVPIDSPQPGRGTKTPRGSDVESAGETSPDRVDPDAPGSTLFNEREDAVEPNEPG